MERGGNQYGPRFHYEAFLFLALFVAANVFRGGTLARRSRAATACSSAGLAASVAAMPVSFVVHAVIEREVIRERMDPFTHGAAPGLRQALVLIGGRVGTARSMAAFDLTRNGIDYSGSVLYGLDLGEAEHCAPTRTAAGTHHVSLRVGPRRGSRRPSAARLPLNP